MSYTIYNEQTTATPVGKCTISFNCRRNKIYLSAEAVRKLGLTAGDKISFVQEQDEDRNWYLIKDTETGITLYSERKERIGLYMKRKVIAENVVDLSGEVESITCKLIAQPVGIPGIGTGYPIIIPKPKN